VHHFPRTDASIWSPLCNAIQGMASGAMSKASERAETTKGAQKRQAILHAARQCFEQYGFSKTTMEDIAKACRITKSSLFYYYDSKDALFYYSFTKVWEDALVSLIEKVRAASPLETRIQDYIRASAGYYAQTVETFRTPVSVLVENEDHFARIFQPTVQAQIVGFYEEVLNDGRAAGLFHNEDNARLARLIGRISRSFRADAFAQAHRQGQAQVDFDILADDTCHIVSLLLAGIQHPDI